MMESLLEFLHKTPFQPFKIVTGSGDTYEVQAPDLVGVGQSMINYFYPRSDRWVFIQLNQISALEPAVPSAR